MQVPCSLPAVNGEVSAAKISMIQQVDRTESLSIGAVNLQMRHAAPQRNLNPISPISAGLRVSKSDGIATNLRPDSVEAPPSRGGAGSFSDELNGLMDVRTEKEKNDFLGNTRYETTFYHAFPSFPMLSPVSIVQVSDSRNGVEGRGEWEGEAPAEPVRGESVGVRQSGDDGIQSGIRLLTNEPINDAAPTMAISEGNPTDALQSPPVQSETVKKPAMEAEPAGEIERITLPPHLSSLLKRGGRPLGTGGFDMEKLASHEKGNTTPETMKPGGQTISDSWNLHDPTDPERSLSARPEGPSRPLEEKSVIEGKYPVNHFSDNLKSPPSLFEKGGRGGFDELNPADLREGPELHWGREIPDHRLGEDGKIPVRPPESSGAHFDMGKRETQGDSERGRDASGKGVENIPIAERGFQPSLVLPEVVPSIPADHPVRAELVQKLAAEIRLNLYPGNNEIEIKLQPEHLGKLKIKILEKENVFTIEIKTAHLDVKGILEQGLSALKQNLEGAGVAVGSFNVLLENGSGGASYNPLWREAQGRADTEARERGGEGARGRGSAVRRAITGEGIVNILV